MRVITGTARGRKLVTVEGTEVVRPTTDGVKEAIFSAIQFEIEGKLGGKDIKEQINIANNIKTQKKKKKR